MKVKPSHRKSVSSGPALRKIDRPGEEKRAEKSKPREKSSFDVFPFLPSRLRMGGRNGAAAKRDVESVNLFFQAFWT